MIKTKALQVNLNMIQSNEKNYSIIITFFIKHIKGNKYHK